MRNHMDYQLLEVLTRLQARVEARRKATEKEVRKQSLKEREQRKREQAMRDHMDDQLLEVLTRSQARVEARRKATEKEIRDEKLRLLDAISKRLETSTSERDAKEQASFVKAIAERNAAVEARQKAALEKKERHRRDKMVAHEQFLRDEEQRLHEEETMAQWGLMNRFKNQEIYDEYRENMRKEKERKEKEYREAIIKQEEETTALAARARQESLHFYGALAEQKFREADNKLLTYSLQLLEEARRNGRPTLPIKKAIDRYCKMYRLYPMPNLPKSLQEHFAGYAPRDGSTPDVDYQEPPPPPPERSLTEMDDKYERQKRDGLQKIFKAPKPKESPKSSEMKPQESLPDYKRQGRANGLQRKKTPPPREEIVLPPITVVTYPCKQLGLVSTEPIKTEQPCDCVQFGEI
ncbi:trichohyalin-like [Phthorimaea operculella]|nr:trichohyalin-like [Phthorimaea operculella]